MLFRTSAGNLIELKRKDFKNDKLFYEKHFNLYCQTPKDKNTFPQSSSIITPNQKNTIKTI